MQLRLTTKLDGRDNGVLSCNKSVCNQNYDLVYLAESFKKQYFTTLMTMFKDQILRVLSEFFVFSHACIDMCVYVCVCTYIISCSCKCVCLCMYVCMHVCIYM